MLFFLSITFICFSLRVTILKDKDTRESKGVAFVLFLDRHMAQNAVAAVNRKQVKVHENSKTVVSILKPAK